MKPFKKRLFGDEQRFSTICEYDPDYMSKDYIFGSIYCMCHGQIIGDDSTVVLPTATTNIESIMNNYDYKLAKNFINKDPIDTFKYICSVIDEVDNPDYDLQIKLSKLRLDIGAIIFDGFDICLLSDEVSNIEILTWKGYNLDKIFSYTLEYGEIFKTLNELCCFVGSLQMQGHATTAT